MLKPSLSALLLAGLLSPALPVLAEDAPPAPALIKKPLLIAHRGASGYRPEHTLAAYQLAIQQGADCIEPDLVMSGDGELIARHEPLLARVLLDAQGQIQRDAQGRPLIHRSETSTNVWQLPQFASRLRFAELDGKRMAGWWAEDFTAAELRQHVRAQERLRDLRLANTAHDDQQTIPTLAEVIGLAKAAGVCLYPETKHPSHHLALARRKGLARLEDRLLEQLHAAWGDKPEAPVYIQSFEVGNLQYLSGKTRLRLVQLLSAQGRPLDHALSYQELAGPAGLDFIKGYAQGVGAHLALLAPERGLLREAHGRGLVVHGWTLRAENSFLPPAWRRGSAPGELGDMQGFVRSLLDQGLDGFFTDQPDLGRAALAR